MIKLYPLKQAVLLAFVVAGVNGCHQEPLLPGSAIPLTCRVTQVVTIDQTDRDSLLFRYDNFGQLTAINDRRWISGQLKTATDQTFIYSTDHYLSGQTDKTTTYSGASRSEVNTGYIFTYQDNPKLIKEIQILNNSTGKAIGRKVYGYEGTTLKTYTESDTSTRTYSYDAAGKLIKFDAPGYGNNITVANGKITKADYGSLVYTYEYDSRGQLTKQQVSSAGTTTNTKSVVVYTYDTKPYWKLTQLRFRGIPTPDLGTHIQATNTLTATTQDYQNDRLMTEAKTVYNYTYNKDNYSIGYGRSDGARQIIGYSNCP